MVENKIFLDTDTICLDKNFSTTRLISREKSERENHPEDKLTSVLFLPEGEGRQGEGGLRTKGYFKKSYDNKPMISVVTVVYNGKKYLEQTISSVLEQGYDNVEYIIIDGGSTDETVDVIKKYEDQIDYWVSERDGGIYDAMNKGISLSLGEYVIFMNADDLFLDNSIELVANSSLHTKPDYIFGDLNRLGMDGSIEVHKGDLKTYKKYTPIGHQALFVKSEILKKIPFDTKYRIMADYHLMIKLINLKFTYVYINKSIATFKLGGVSSVDSYKDTERFGIQYKNFGFWYAILGYLKGTKQPAIYAVTSRLVKLKKRYVK